MIDLRLYADSRVAAWHRIKFCMATLSNLNEVGRTKMFHDFEPLLIAVLMHTSVAVMYPRFDYIKFAQIAVQQKSVP